MYDRHIMHGCIGSIQVNGVRHTVALEHPRVLVNQRNVVATVEVTAQLSRAMRAFEKAHRSLLRRAVNESNPDIKRALPVVRMMWEILMPRRVATRLR